jgi:hypothetical protein
MTDLKAYRVLDGVETVDGQRVPEDRIVRLSDISARFDLDAGKIVPLDEAKPARTESAKPAQAEAVKGKLPADG